MMLPPQPTFFAPESAFAEAFCREAARHLKDAYIGPHRLQAGWAGSCNGATVSLEGRDTMKCFLPFADDAQAQRVYDAVKENLRE